MPTDKMTKVLLAAIALGLFLNAAVDLFRLPLRLRPSSSGHARLRATCNTSKTILRGSTEEPVETKKFADHETH